MSAVFLVPKDPSEMTPAQLRDYEEAKEARKREVERKALEILDKELEFQEMLDDEFYKSEFCIDLARLCAAFKRTGNIDYVRTRAFLQIFLELAEEHAEKRVPQIDIRNFQ